MERARETCEVWAREFPRAWEPHVFLSGMVYPALGSFEKAADEASIATRLSPNFVFGYSNRPLSLVYLGRLSEAETASTVIFVAPGSMSNAAATDFVVHDFVHRRRAYSGLCGSCVRMFAISYVE
jgi:hypothetical protein